MGDIDAEGEYRALTALYNGEESARGYESGAAAKQQQAASVRRASNISTGSTLLGTGYSLLPKYG